MGELRVAWGQVAGDTPYFARLGYQGETPEMVGEGWTGGEALDMALTTAVRHEDDWRVGVLETANASGNSDSAATLTGSVLGSLPRCRGYTRRLGKRASRMRDT